MPRLPDLADLGMVGVIIVAVVVSVLQKSFQFKGDVLSASLIGFALSFLITSRSLRGRKEIGVERIFISLCVMISAVWLFELLWRLWGFDTYGLFVEQLFTLTFATPWSMSWALMMVALACVGIRYMRFNRWFWITLALAMATFYLWKATGFPQFISPQWWPSKNPSIYLIPIEYTHAPTPEARAAIVFWGGLLNSVTKVFWCALPATLFLTPENLGASLSSRIRHPLPSLKRLLLPWTDWGNLAAAPASATREPHGVVAPTTAREGRPKSRAGPSLARMTSLMGIVRDAGAPFVHRRLADLADLTMLAVIPAVAVIAAWNRSFAVQGDVLAFSLMAYAVAYLIASRSLRRCKGVGYERIFLALAVMVSGVWLFEVVSRYGWLLSWQTLGQSWTDFNIRPSEPHEPFPLMWAAVMISVLFVARRHMKLNRWFGLALVAGAVTFVLWLGCGYPSYQDAWRSPQMPKTFEFIHLIPPQYANPKSPSAPGWAFVAFWGAIFTGLAKLFVCSLPALLLAHNLQRKRGGDNGPPDDLLARGWKAVAAPFALLGRRGRVAREAAEPEPRSGNGNQAVESADSEDLSAESAPLKAPVAIKKGGQAGIVAGALIAALRSALARPVGLFRSKLADAADLFMMVVLVLALGVSTLNHSFIFHQSALTASLVGFALCYLIASRSLRKQKDIGVERVFISLGVMVSGVWLFEIVYHYGWLLPPPRIAGDLGHIGMITSDPFPFTFGLLMVALGFAGLRHMRLNRWFYLCTLLAVVSMAFWIAIGYPNYFHPEWWPHDPLLLPVIPRGYVHATTPPGSDVIAFWGGLMNSIAKILVSILPATFYIPPATGEGGERRLRAALDRLLRAIPVLGARRAPSRAASSEHDDPARSWKPAWLALPDSMVRRLATLKARLPEIADVAMVGVIVGAVALAVASRSLAIPGNFLAASFVAPALCFLLASRGLRRCQGVGPERIFKAACAMASGIWLFEALSYFGWISYWPHLGASLTTLDINLPYPGKAFPLMWAIIMVSLLFVGARNMRVNKWFWIVLAAAAAAFLLWLAVGYPSYHEPWRSPQMPRTFEVFHLIPPEYANPRTPGTPGWEYVSSWGAVFTSVTKLFVGILPATLFLHNLKRSKRGGSGPPDDAPARAWNALLARFDALLRRPPRSGFANACSGEGKSGTGAIRTRGLPPANVAIKKDHIKAPPWILRACSRLFAAGWHNPPRLHHGLPGRSGDPRLGGRRPVDPRGRVRHVQRRRVLQGEGGRAPGVRRQLRAYPR